MYSLYLYFLDLSLCNTSKALVIFKDEKRSYVSVWNWIHRFGSLPIYKRDEMLNVQNVLLRSSGMVDQAEIHIEFSGEEQLSDIDMLSLRIQMAIRSKIPSLAKNLNYPSFIYYYCYIKK